MTTVQVDFWDLARMSGAVVAFLIGAFWTLVVMMVRQFKADLTTRFEELETTREEANKRVDERLVQLGTQHAEANARANERLDQLEALQRSTDKDILLLRVELPDKYVRREDAIRSEMGLHAKLDGLATRFDSLLRTKTNV
jgi:hypothetical protein